MVGKIAHVLEGSSSNDRFRSITCATISDLPFYISNIDSKQLIYESGQQMFVLRTIGQNLSNNGHNLGYMPRDER